MFLVIDKDKVSFLEGERVFVRVMVGFLLIFGDFNHLECHMSTIIFFLKGEKTLFEGSGLW